ncbi:MAG: thiamine pyrophosphate-binding protein [Lachnospiraceae bacterium]|nr:thiamine pyrophosphate-binding protein [Lachnospiraceae bacterium]
MKKRVADIVVDTLKENGIKDCFCVVGGGSMHLNNALVLSRDSLALTYCHHESSCSMAAEGYARYSGQMACVCVTSGPGGTNAINGVQGAWVDSVPMIVISGHPRQATTVEASGLKLRSRGVQENDIISMVKGITKYAVLVKDPLDIRRELQKAIDLAMSGRRGPSWVSIPLDVQGARIEEDELRAPEPLSSDTMPSEDSIREIVSVLKDSKRPCILTGSGIRTSDAESGYREFASHLRIPIVGGALQADINYHGERYYYGNSGSIGPRCGNFMLQSADVILVLGNSLSTTQTGFNQEAFAPDAKIIMVDVDSEELKKKEVHAAFPLCSDLNAFFKAWQAYGSDIDAPEDWISHCDMLYKKLSRYELIDRHKDIDKKGKVPSAFFWYTLLNNAEEDAVIALGNSTCITDVLRYGISRAGQRVLVNYKCGSMGHDLPNAIGACIAAGKKPVYCVTGDGSVMMNLQELQTIAYNRLPVRLVVFNNNGYGAIRNTCSNFFEGTYTGCDESSGISFPDFSLVAACFGLPYRCCSDIASLESAVEWLKSAPGACLLEICECENEIREPVIRSKMDENGVFTTPALHDMWPYLDDAVVSECLMKD